MKEHEKHQIEHFLNEFTKLCNAFFKDGNEKLTEYWRGQVYGMCKVITTLGLNIDTDEYLKKLP